MITVTLNVPEIEQELNEIASTQHIGVDEVVVGALAQAFNKPQLLTALGFVCKPLSCAASANT